MKRIRKELSDLEINIEKAIKEKKKLISEKEKEKILSNNSYKKQMKEKLEEANRSLKIWKNKEIEGSKKLSILQNLQLVVELENQSERIEYYIDQNTKLREKITELTREVSTHKYVEVNFSKKSNSNQQKILELTEQQNKRMGKLQQFQEKQKKCEMRAKNLENNKSISVKNRKIQKDIFQLENQIKYLSKSKLSLIKKNETLNKNLVHIQNKSFFNIDFIKENYKNEIDFDSEFFKSKLFKNEEILLDQLGIDKSQTGEIIDQLIVELYPLMKSLIINVYSREKNQISEIISLTQTQVKKFDMNNKTLKYPDYLKKEKRIQEKAMLLMDD